MFTYAQHFADEQSFCAAVVDADTDDVAGACDTHDPEGPITSSDCGTVSVQSA